MFWGHIRCHQQDSFFLYTLHVRNVFPNTAKFALLTLLLDHSAPICLTLHSYFYTYTVLFLPWCLCVVVQSRWLLILIEHIGVALVRCLTPSKAASASHVSGLGLEPSALCLSTLSMSSNFPLDTPNSSGSAKTSG